MQKHIEPIQQTAEAKPHRSIYRMHRYFARRPYSVFNQLVRHYTNHGDVILDPFCGGGVTLVEGVIEQRKVIGFDINPLARFITHMELSGVDINALQAEQRKVCDEFKLHNDSIFLLFAVNVEIKQRPYGLNIHRS